MAPFWSQSGFQTLKYVSALRYTITDFVSNSQSKKKEWNLNSCMLSHEIAILWPAQLRGRSDGMIILLQGMKQIYTKDVFFFLSLKECLASNNMALIPSGGLFSSRCCSAVDRAKLLSFFCGVQQGNVMLLWTSLLEEIQMAAGAVKQ